MRLLVPKLSQSRNFIQMSVHSQINGAEEMCKETCLPDTVPKTRRKLKDAMNTCTNTDSGTPLVGSHSATARPHFVQPASISSQLPGNFVRFSRIISILSKGLWCYADQNDDRENFQEHGARPSTNTLTLETRLTPVYSRLRPLLSSTSSKESELFTVAFVFHHTHSLSPTMFPMLLAVVFALGASSASITHTYTPSETWCAYIGHPDYNCTDTIQCYSDWPHATGNYGVEGFDPYEVKADEIMLLGGILNFEYPSSLFIDGSVSSLAALLSRL